MSNIIAAKTPEAANVDEVVRRLSWAFMAAGIRFIKTDKTTGARMKTDGKAWGYVLEDMTKLGWEYHALLSAPPVQLHLSAALKALEAGDAATAYFHINRLAQADKPTEQQEVPQLPHLLVPMGDGGWGGGLFPGEVTRTGKKLGITATGTVIKGAKRNE